MQNEMATEIVWWFVGIVWATLDIWLCEGPLLVDVGVSLVFSNGNHVHKLYGKC